MPKSLLVVGTILAAIVFQNTIPALAANAEHWAATWTAALQGAPPTKVTVENQTVRQTVEISIGGSRFRVWLSNEYGEKPLLIGAATMGLSDAKGSIGNFARISFDGKGKVVIPPGVRMVSDPINIRANALHSLVVSLYLPDETPLATFHSEDVRGSSPRAHLASGASISSEGNFTAATSMPAAVLPVSTHVYPPFLAAVDTMAPKSTRVIVILGDTKSEGPDFWPNYLRDRLAKSGMAIANMSQYAGTLTLYQPFGTGLTRFDRDVLGVSGVTDVFLFNASNDINMPGMNGRRSEDVIPNEDIELAITQVVTRAHAAGLKVIGATLIPFEGVLRPGYATPDHMQRRDELNAWLRTTQPFDVLVDFDAVVRDPSRPERLLPAFDVGNHFTPSEAGEKALADAIHIKLFQ